MLDYVVFEPARSLKLRKVRVLGVEGGHGGRFGQLLGQVTLNLDVFRSRLLEELGLLDRGLLHHE